jgi:hypothetical protein
MDYHRDPSHILKPVTCNITIKQLDTNKGWARIPVIRQTGGGGESCRLQGRVPLAIYNPNGVAGIDHAGINGERHAHAAPADETVYGGQVSRAPCAARSPSARRASASRCG